MLTLGAKTIVKQHTHKYTHHIPYTGNNMTVMLSLAIADISNCKVGSDTKKYEMLSQSRAHSTTRAKNNSGICMRQRRDTTNEPK